MTDDNDLMASEVELLKARAVAWRGLGAMAYLGTLLGIGWSIWAWVR